jgi:hypothetical protein
MHPVLLYPSFYAHVLNGVFLFLTIVLLYRNYSSVTKYNVYSQLMLLLLLSIAVGIHGISHLGLETIYKYHPLYYIDQNLNTLR